jgi:hypothetical protein
MPLTTPERRRLCHVSPDHGASGTPDPSLVAWLATLTPGTRGTASGLLPSLRAMAPACDDARSPATLGAALARLGMPHARSGATSLWTLAPAPVALPWH